MSVRKVIAFLFFWVILVSLTACTEVREVSVSFPETDIVFQSGNPDKQSIGFVNSDGSDHTIIPIDFDVSRPFWSSDGQTIYSIEPPGGGSLIAYPGRLNIWRNGESVKTCKNRSWRYVTNIATLLPEKHLALIVNRSLLQIADLDRCREIDTLIRADNSIIGASLSSDGKQIVYSEMISTSEGYTYLLNTYDLETEHITNIGEGINPAWSPDSKMIAYTSKDGIYVLEVDNLTSQRIISYDAMISKTQYEKAPPSPQWSPDGKSIIYHKCVESGENCHHASEFVIYKFNLETGEEIKIVDGGLYPYWR